MVRFCSICENLLLPNDGKLFCNVCDTEFPIEELEENIEIKKIRYEEKDFGPVIIRKSLTKKISKEDRKAFEDFFNNDISE